MESVGYDLYIKLLEEAVLEERGEKVEPRVDTFIDISVDAFIPEKYIKPAQIRMDIYKKIALIDNGEDAEDLKIELKDRFGTLPQGVVNLVDISLIRRAASKLKFTTIEQKNGAVLLYSDNFNEEAVFYIIRNRLMKGRLTYSPNGRRYMSYRCQNSEKVLDAIKQLLTAYENILQK